jgi:hypothetical protein
MSNHSGSYMLNDIIKLLNDEQVLNIIGLQKSQQVITQIVKIASRDYDCKERRNFRGSHGLSQSLLLLSFNYN